MKKHPILIVGKICSKCNIDKVKNNFHNDKNKKMEKTICKECIKDPCGSVKLTNDVEGTLWDIKSDYLEENNNIILNILPHGSLGQ